MIPTKVFFTKGVGRDKQELKSFEAALRDAGIAHLNLSYISSIFAPNCKLLSKEEGLKLLKPGEITFVILSRNCTNENRRLIAASIGYAIPANSDAYGYISEHHVFGKTDETAGDEAEDMAATMLASTLGIQFDPEASYDEKQQLWKISDKIYRTGNITQSAYGETGIYTTVIAAAVFVETTLDQKIEELYKKINNLESLIKSSK
ncbi:MAG: arginine decarboxylase, pyruvoyl-dependent [Candidatus Pacearchaeota archaeon]|nr:arginine decarboxylase, pyruvoyl-dependent [Candidatus Pacearchaeota archaeon]